MRHPTYPWPLKGNCDSCNCFVNRTPKRTELSGLQLPGFADMANQAIASPASRIEASQGTATAQREFGLRESQARITITSTSRAPGSVTKKPTSTQPGSWCQTGYYLS